MIRPPLLMHMRFHKGEKQFGIWLPLFLLIPLALVVLIILSPLIIIAIVVLWPSGWGKRALLVLRVAIEIFVSIRGLTVDIQSRQQYVIISVV